MIWPSGRTAKLAQRDGRVVLLLALTQKWFSAARHCMVAGTISFQMLYRASATTLTEMFGVGPIIVAMLIGYTGDPARFPTAGHFAAYNGTAPIEFSSSGRTVHRLSRRGNRTLNHAIHLIAVTQIRHPHSEGRAYYDHKLAAGSPPRIAMRALKRHISNRVFRHLRDDIAR